VAGLSGDVVRAAQELAVHGDADAAAVRDADERHRPVHRRVAAHCPDLREDARLHRILERHRQLRDRAERSHQIDIAPPERRRVLELAAVQIDQPGDHDANAMAAELRMVGICLTRPPGS
jgi:hypothetical protein